MQFGRELNPGCQGLQKYDFSFFSLHFLANFVLTYLRSERCMSNNIFFQSPTLLDIPCDNIFSYLSKTFSVFHQHPREPSDNFRSLGEGRTRDQGTTDSPVVRKIMIRDTTYRHRCISNCLVFLRFPTRRVLFTEKLLRIWASFYFLVKTSIFH